LSIFEVYGAYKLDKFLEMQEAVEPTMIELCATKGDKIHHLTAEEKSLYLKDAFALYPEVKKISGPIGNKFIGLLAPYRDK